MTETASPLIWMPGIDEKYTTVNANGDEFPPVTAEGIAAALAKLGPLRADPDPEGLGRFRIRGEASILPPDRGDNPLTGWTVTETIGMAVMNPKGVAGLRGMSTGGLLKFPKIDMPWLSGSNLDLTWDPSETTAGPDGGVVVRISDGGADAWEMTLVGVISYDGDLATFRGTSDRVLTPGVGVGGAMRIAVRKVAPWADAPHDNTAFYDAVVETVVGYARAAAVQLP
jgi:hypothetical protein